MENLYTHKFCTTMWGEGAQAGQEGLPYKYLVSTSPLGRKDMVSIWLLQVPK